MEQQACAIQSTYLQTQLQSALPMQGIHNRQFDWLHITAFHIKNPITSAVLTFPYLRLPFRRTNMRLMHLSSQSAWRSTYSDRKVLTLAANLRLVMVSLRCAFRGLIMTNINVFEFPPNEYRSKCVNYPSVSSAYYLNPEPVPSIRLPYLAIPVWRGLTGMQGTDNVPEISQAFVDVLRFLQPVARTLTVAESLTAR